MTWRTYACLLLVAVYLGLSLVSVFVPHGGGWTASAFPFLILALIIGNGGRAKSPIAEHG